MNNIKFKCSIFMQNVQDARLLKNFLSRYKMIKVEGFIHSTAEATEHFHDENPTLLFTDIDNYHILKNLQKPPFVVGVGDKTNAIMMRKLLMNGMFDFIFLPISEISLNVIMNKIFNILRINPYSHTEATPVASDSDSTYNGKPVSLTNSIQRLNYNYMYAFSGRLSQPVKIVFDDVLYLKKVGNHICIHSTNNDNQYMKSTLKYFNERLPKHTFLKINQSTIINIEKIRKIENLGTVIVGEETFLVARSFRKLLKQRIYR